MSFFIMEGVNCFGDKPAKIGNDIIAISTEL